MADPKVSNGPLFAGNESEQQEHLPHSGAISEMDTPLTPAAEGNRSMSAWITHMTEEDYQSVRNQVLDAQPEDIRALAGGIRELLKEGSFCVIGNESRLEKDKELFDQVKNL